MRALLAAGDPLLNGNIDFGVFLVICIKTFVTFAVLMVAVLFMVWFERKVISDMQNRIGPNRAGPWGLLQTLADGIKLFFKEDLLPERADRRIFRLAPYLSAVPAFLSFAIVPIGGDIDLFGTTTRLQLADPPIGILFLLAMSSVAVYGVMLAGWSSGSKYPLLGSVRASAQMVSYEAALGLVVATIVLVSGSLYTSEIVFSQAESFASWNLIRLGILPFFLFLIAATAELNRPPFDLVEAEQELVGGFHTEYSSIRFALFFLAEFMNTVTMSAIIVTLFLGGPTVPFDLGIPGLGRVSPIWFVVKIFIFLFTYVWFRATLPRLRYDQLMDLGWKALIPASLAWLLVIAAITVERSYLLIAFPVLLLCAAMLYRSLALGKATVQEEDLHAVMGALDGFKVTFKQMFLPRVTVSYPDEKRPKPDRHHGRHVLNRYEDGMEKCIGCELCAGVCPARCIYVRGADNPPDAPVSPGERFGFVYEINYLRCIHCDLCVEACPTEAITETKLFEFSFTNRQDAIYTKEELLVGDDGKPKKLPWEHWGEGDDEITSQWVRATAPSGNADFEGVVQWSGELGKGVADPELSQTGADEETGEPWWVLSENRGGQ